MIEAYSDPPPTNSIKIKKPVAKKATQPQQSTSREFQSRESPRKNFDETKANNFSATPNKRDKLRQQRWYGRDEEAFGSPIDHSMLADFDFEKNLALFNKKAFYDEINASKPDVIRQADKKGGKYRCDENVLNSKPAAYRQLLVPQSDSIEYVTDTGLVVPSITLELRKRVFAVAERLGLSFERQSEIIGRACTELSLLLLGGAHRLNPQNQHQCPSVVVLCGSHRTGSQGVNCARQLASHGVRTTVYIQDPVDLTTEMTYELALYRMTSNKITTNLQGKKKFFFLSVIISNDFCFFFLELSTAPVDLIILALLDSNTTSKKAIQPAARWANENRAQVLALDPPQSGTAGVTAKCSLIPGLPLGYDSCNGKLYLCNVGIPLQVFKDVGIKYVSPFGPKFYMPLYPNDI